MKKINLNSENAYTLIELLAVMAVLITVGTIIAGIIVSSLRGSNKSRNVGDVRQAGNSALVQMTKTITYSKSFDGLSEDGTNYVTNCILPQITPTPAPTQYKYLKITGFDDGQTILACNGTSISSNSADLIDSSNDSSKFTVSNCYFLCLQTNITVPPTININYTVSFKSKTPNSTFVEDNVSQNFTTSAAFRNN